MDEGLVPAAKTRRQKKFAAADAIARVELLEDMSAEGCGGAAPAASSDAAAAPASAASNRKRSRGLLAAADAVLGTDEHGTPIDVDVVEGFEMRSQSMGERKWVYGILEEAAAAGLTLRRSGNTTGFKGVTLTPSRKSFTGKLWNGRTRKEENLGSFPTAEAAALAVARATYAQQQQDSSLDSDESDSDESSLDESSLDDDEASSDAPAADPKEAAAEALRRAAAEGFVLQRSSNATGFKGVYVTGRRFAASASGEYLGTFATAEQAALAVALRKVAMHSVTEPWRDEAGATEGEEEQEEEEEEETPPPAPKRHASARKSSTASGTGASGLLCGRASLKDNGTWGCTRVAGHSGAHNYTQGSRRPQRLTGRVAWACPKCTYHNSAHALRCGVCEALPPAQLESPTSQLGERWTAPEEAVLVAYTAKRATIGAHGRIDWSEIDGVIPGRNRTACERHWRIMKQPYHDPRRQPYANPKEQEGTSIMREGRCEVAIEPAPLVEPDEHERQRIIDDDEDDDGDSDNDEEEAREEESVITFAADGDASAALRQAAAEGLTLHRSERCSTGFRGVYVSGAAAAGRFDAKYRARHLGMFGTPEEGALAYARAVKAAKEQKEVDAGEEEDATHYLGTYVTPPAALGGGARDDGAGAEAARLAAAEAANQCARNPLCIRGYKHGGRGGHCSMAAGAEAEEVARGVEEAALVHAGEREACARARAEHGGAEILKAAAADALRQAVAEGLALERSERSSTGFRGVKRASQVVGNFDAKYRGTSLGTFGTAEEAALAFARARAADEEEQEEEEEGRGPEQEMEAEAAAAAIEGEGEVAARLLARKRAAAAPVREGGGKRPATSSTSVMPA